MKLEENYLMTPAARQTCGGFWSFWSVAVTCFCLIATIAVRAQDSDKNEGGQMVTAPQSIANFSNVSPINIPSIGGASSSITVSGLAGSVSKLTVTLNGIVHLTPSDLDFLLIAPDGRKLVILSDAGGAFPLADSIVRLSDTNAARVPATSTIGNGVVDYQPTNYGSFDTFTGISGFPPSVAPGGSETLSSGFDFSDPNGVWTLIVQDDTSGGNGANSRLARGWSLRIETPQTVIVNSVNDVNDGGCDTFHCSLREAIEFATVGSEIKFGTGFGGAVVVLNGDSLLITKRLTISALDFNGLKVSISGNQQSRVIFIDLTGDLTLNNIAIIGGRSLQSGAGILNGGKLTMNSCLVRGNRIIGENAGLLTDGAGIASFGILKMTTTIVELNEIESTFVASQGAGIFLGAIPNIPQDAQIISCIIRNNRLRSPNGSGSSVLDGGGLALFQSKAVVIDSTIHNNFAKSNGGGIYNDQGDLTLINTTIANNQAGKSSAVGNTPLTTSKMLAVNSTFVFNSTVSSCAINGVGGNFRLKNSLVSNNGFCDVDTVVSLGNNLFRNLRSVVLQPGDIVTQNAGLGEFGDNGGIVPTVPLLSGSPAINGGSDCVMLAPQNDGCSPTQIFNDARFLPRKSGIGVDIGAFELQLAPSAALVSVSGRILTSDGIGLRNARVVLTEGSGNTQTVLTGSFGYFRFEEVTAGETIVISVISKRFQFQPEVIFINENIEDLILTAVVQ